MSANSLLRSLVLLVAVACAALSLSGGEAHARVKGGRLDSLSIACGAWQDRYDQILNQIRDNQLSQEQYDALIQEGRNIVSNWNSVCAGTFGSINYLRLSPVTAGKLTGNPTLAQPATSLTPTSPTQGTKKLQPRSVLIKMK